MNAHESSFHVFKFTIWYNSDKLMIVLKSNVRRRIKRNSMEKNYQKQTNKQNNDQTATIRIKTLYKIRTGHNRVFFLRKMSESVWLCVFWKRLSCQLSWRKEKRASVSSRSGCHARDASFSADHDLRPHGRVISHAQHRSQVTNLEGSWRNFKHTVGQNNQEYRLKYS